MRYSDVSGTDQDGAADGEARRITYSDGYRDGAPFILWIESACTHQSGDVMLRWRLGAIRSSRLSVYCRV